MAEHGSERYRWTESRIRLDLYRLLACFFASSSLSELRDEMNMMFDSVENLRMDAEKVEIHELLLKIAASFRAQQDHEPGWANKIGPEKVNPYHNDCGTFWPNAEESQSSEPLVLREACNKILHATGFEHVTRETNHPLVEPSLLPVMNLYGKRSGKTWKAELDIVKFVDCLFYNYEGQ